MNIETCSVSFSSMEYISSPIEFDEITDCAVLAEIKEANISATNAKDPYANITIGELKTAAGKAQELIKDSKFSAENLRKIADYILKSKKTNAGDKKEPSGLNPGRRITEKSTLRDVFYGSMSKGIKLLDTLKDLSTITAGQAYDLGAAKAQGDAYYRVMFNNDMLGGDPNERILKFFTGDASTHKELDLDLKSARGQKALAEGKWVIKKSEIDHYGPLTEIGIAQVFSRLKVKGLKVELESAAPTPPPASPPAGIKPEKISPLPTKKLSPANSLYANIKPNGAVILKLNTVVQIDQIEGAGYYNKASKSFITEVGSKDVTFKIGDSQYKFVNALKRPAGDVGIRKDELSDEALSSVIRFNSGQEMRLEDVFESKAATYFYESGDTKKGENILNGKLVLSNVKNAADYNKLIADTRYKIEKMPGTQNMQVSFPDGGWLILENMYSERGDLITRGGIDSVIIPNGAGDGLKIPIVDFVAKKPINNA